MKTFAKWYALPLLWMLIGYAMCWASNRSRIEELSDRVNGLSLCHTVMRLAYDSGGGLVCYEINKTGNKMSNLTISDLPKR